KYLRDGFPRARARKGHDLNKRWLKRQFRTFLAHSIQKRLHKALHVTPLRSSKHHATTNMLGEMGHLDPPYGLPARYRADGKNGNSKLTQERSDRGISLIDA